MVQTQFPLPCCQLVPLTAIATKHTLHRTQEGAADEARQEWVDPRCGDPIAKFSISVYMAVSICIRVKGGCIASMLNYSLHYLK